MKRLKTLKLSKNVRQYLFSGFLMIVLFLAGSANAKQLFDDFSESGLKEDRWRRPLKLIRKIDSGKYLSEIDSVTSDQGHALNQLAFMNPHTIHTIEANVTIKAARLDNYMTFVASQIEGHYYEGPNGIVWAALHIGDRGNGLKAWYQLVDGNAWPPDPLSSAEFATPIQYDTEYTLKLSYDGNRTFTFSVNNETKTYIGPSVVRVLGQNEAPKFLTTGIWSYDLRPIAGLGRGYIAATFDDVKINNNQDFYDQFDAALIDTGKWGNGMWVADGWGYGDGFENIKNINTGRLQLDVRGMDVRTTLKAPFEPTDFTNYLEAKVLVKNDSQLSAGASGIARIGAEFYNDKYGPGSGRLYNMAKGDIWIDNRLVLDEAGNLKARASAWRTEDPYSTSFTEIYGQDFPTIVNFDQQYNLSIERIGSQVIFKCNNDTLTYDITTPIHGSYYNSRELCTRIYLDPGESGYMKAEFDDVYIDSGGSISGVVYNSSGIPLGNVVVHAANTTGPGYGWVETNPATGAYTFTGLPTGEYRVEAQPQRTALPYMDEYFDNIQPSYSSTLVDVISPADTSDIDFFLNAQTLPGPVIQNGPEGTAAFCDCKAPFYWEDVAGATWYQLWVNDSAGNNVIQKWYESVNICFGGECGVLSPIALDTGETYSWWIRTYNPAGYGAWSDGLTFTILCAPSYINVIDPSGDIPECGPTFQWSGSQCASWFYLWVNKPEGGHIEKWIEAKDHCTMIDNEWHCNYQFDNPFTKGAHQWWARPWSSNGYGPWSEGLPFNVTGDQCACPHLPPLATTQITPPDNQTLTTCVDTLFQWQDIDCTTWYQLWINGPEGHVFDQWYQIGSADIDCQNGVCSVTVPDALVCGDHSWWVQTYSDGGKGPWSSGSSFNVSGDQCVCPNIPPTKTTQMTPSEGQVLTTITDNLFQWRDIDCTTYYQLWINGPEGHVFDQWYQKGSGDIDCQNGVCSVTVPNTLFCGPHTWWVQTYNPNGKGPWSDGSAFNVSGDQCVCPKAPPANTIQMTPQEGALVTTCDDNLFQWRDIDCTTYYQLWINNQQGHVFNNWYQKGDADIDCQNGVCSVTVPDELACGVHSWWVQTYNDNGKGPWSEGAEFIANCDQCTCLPVPPPELYQISPDDDVLNANNDIQFKFTDTSAGCATYFHLWVNNETGTAHEKWYQITDPAVNCANGECDITLVGGFDMSGKYSWWVQPWCTYGKGPWSAGLDFVID